MSKQELMTLKDIDKALSKHVSDAGARIEKPAGQSIGIKGKKFKYKDDVIGRVAAFVIVDFIRANAYYDSPFHEDTIELPACLALSVDGEDMAPLEHAPRKQNKQCDGCEKNAWGSADVGRGKMCAEQYRLAILAIDHSRDETYANCDMATVTVPPTSKKNFGKYVRALDENTGRPPLAFLTEFSFDDEFDHEVLLFEVSKPYKDAKTLSAILSRVDEAREMLMSPPDFSGNVKESASKKKTKKKVKVKAKKKTAKKGSKKKTTSKKKASKKTGRSKYA
jgi:hypothetical protein